MILGIDEVGRGPWAGPLVVGAVVLGCDIQGLTDSKKLTKAKLKTLNDEITARAAGIGLGWVHADEIDRIGLSNALVEATKRAVSEISASYHEIIIDGTVNFLKDTKKGDYVTTIKQADLLIPSVSAASIVAKVARDTYMKERAVNYPLYGFESHVGYGTKVHRDAIDVYGVTPLHRLSIAPLARFRTEQQPENTNEKKTTRSATTKKVGDEAESVAAAYLQARGHLVVERNWKTKYCEIDIISRLDNTVYFTEVKYRRNSRHGDGLSAVNSAKLKQMKFAARVYIAHKSLQDIDARLCVIAATNEPPQVIAFVEI